MERNKSTTPFLTNAALVFPLDFLEVVKRFLVLPENWLVCVLELSVQRPVRECASSETNHKDQGDLLCIIFRPEQWWCFVFEAIFFFTCLPRTTVTFSLLNWRALVKYIGKVWAWSFCHADFAKCLSFHLLRLEWEKDLSGSSVTLRPAHSICILPGINLAIMIFVLIFLCLFVDKTSSQQSIMDAERRQVKWLWLHTPNANSICLARFNFYFTRAFCDHEASSLTAPVCQIKLKTSPFCKY